MMSIGTLPRNATYNERRYAFFASREPGIAGQVTLVSRRDQAKDKYDTDRYQVRFSDATHIVFSKMRDCIDYDGAITFAKLTLFVTPYSVWLRDGVRPAGCNCMAGQNDVPCKHRDIARALLASDGPPDFGNVPQPVPTGRTTVLRVP